MMAAFASPGSSDMQRLSAQVHRFAFPHAGSTAGPRLVANEEQRSRFDVANLCKFDTVLLPVLHPGFGEWCSLPGVFASVYRLTRAFCLQ